MSIGISEPRPPYVEFHMVPTEDRTASIEAGLLVMKDVPYAFITPAGSRERIEREVDSWFITLEHEVRAERLPAQWLAEYRRMYKEWLSGNEATISGVALTNWPGISPAQVSNLRQVGIVTVEQLAEANEQALAAIGLGGRALKEKAIAYLAEAASTGKLAEQNVALKLQTEQQAESIDRLEKQVAQLSAKLEAFAKK